ncbi:MAG: hypothetical protein JWR90_2959 [Marmoricola sp.]|nr:hypothetical protein [Marmoricola sp.]
MLRRLTPRTRDESGVVAILVAVLAVLLLMFAAYAVDIGLQVNRKNQLFDALDAAAQAGAYELPASSATARTQALAFAKAHDPTENGTLSPNIDFWCIVASTGTAPYAVDTTQIPATCNPGTGPWVNGATYGGAGQKISCSALICAIPCVEPSLNTGTPKIACNTIRVFQGRDVPFTFARAGGIQKGSTGTVLSVACKGSCGTINPNPMDVVVVADRTPSMSDTNVGDMVSGIKGMFGQMTPSQQYVALGTIGRSTQTTTAAALSRACNSTSKGLTWPAAPSSTGLWIPIPFSDDYVTGAGAVDTNSDLVKAVNCIDTAGQGNSPGGTFLAAPMKAAARYLLGTGSSTNNLSDLPVRTAPVTKVLIFETDGRPYENLSPSTGSADLNVSGDIVSSATDTSEPVTTPNWKATKTQTNTPTTGKTTVTTYNKVTYTFTGGEQACRNLGAVAQNARRAGILVITIAYNLSGAGCEGESKESTDTTTVTTRTVGNTIYQTETTTEYVQPPDASQTSVLNVLAAASGTSDGPSSVAQNTCATAAERTTENSDGDYFFCGATGTDMAPIFKTALSQVTKGIKLMKIP